MKNWDEVRIVGSDFVHSHKDVDKTSLKSIFKNHGIKANKFIKWIEKYRRSYARTLIIDLLEIPNDYKKSRTTVPSQPNRRLVLPNTVMRRLRGMYACAGCGVGAETYCKPGCNHMDPFDYRMVR